MPAFTFIRRGLISAAVLLCAVVVGVAIIIAALDAGYFRNALLGYVERSTQRKITVAGELHVHLFSWHPSVSAHGVTIGNPPWTPPGTAAQIDALNLTFEFAHAGQPGRIDRLAVQGAKLTLYRDAAGHANWQRHNPDEGIAKGVALISSLSVLDARVLLNDERRHLKFDGTASAQDAQRDDGTPALQIQGAGQLNGNAVTIALTGDALPTASHDHPYHFSFSEKSSGSQLNARGSVPKPFDFNLLDAKFEASGADLKDLYYLVGVSLVNTGTYRLTGNYSRSGTRTQFTDLRLNTGQSDLAGAVDVDTVDGRSQSKSTLRAQRLDAADFGLRAAGRDTAPHPLLVSNAAVNPVGLRRADATIDFLAQRFEVGRQVLQDLAVKLVIERGIVTAAPVSAGWLGGKLAGTVKLDANQDVPSATANLSIVGAQLGQLPYRSSDPPLDGAMRLRLNVTGHGASAHEVAASAEGTLVVELPRGSVRASLAELVGMDLRGLGLTLENNKRDTTIRCAKAAFLAHAGVFTAQHLVMDTDPVRIEGQGSVQMDNETLDFVLRGEPKSLRVLRLKAPLLIQGTLAHPSVSIAKSDSKLLLVDRGRAKDEDCAALLH